MQFRSLALSASALCLALHSPVSADTVIITADTVIGPDQSTIVDPATGATVPLIAADVVVQGCTLTVNGRHFFGSLSLVRDPFNEPAILTHSPGEINQYLSSGELLTVEGFEISTTRALSIQGPSGDLVGSRIDLRGKGHAPSSGPGAGNDSSSPGFGASGAGHGGAGAKSGGTPGGDACGSNLIDHPALGSGGGNSGPSLGGAGGGCAAIFARGGITLDGAILCDGLPGQSVAGSGSGGSVFIQTSSITGTGSISANGADGAAGWGGGGGGRITIGEVSSSFAGAVNALGGDSLYSIERGGAGVIVRRAGSTSIPDLVIRSGGNGSLPAALTPAPEFTRVRSLSVDAGANVHFANLTTIDTPLTVNGASTVAFDSLGALTGDLTIRGVSRVITRELRSIAGSLRLEGASIFHPPAGPLTIVGNVLLTGPLNQIVLPTASTSELFVAGAVTIDQRSLIFGNGVGFGADSGAGAGIASPLSGSGGAYGGNGGSSSNHAGGLAYGSVSKPTLPGSGGGSTVRAAGGAGGGALRLIAAGTVTVNGSISCSGGSAPTVNVGAGGGSGGSIMLKTPRLSGSGTILADGGGAGAPGGAGGGGRIAIFTCDNRMPLANIRASRGEGGVGLASAGTRFFGSGSITITQQPQAVETLSGVTVFVETNATSTNGGVSYRWRRRDASGEYQLLSDDARYSGTNTARMTITDATCSDLGAYDCRVTDSCGTFATDDVAVVIGPRADRNGDGSVDSDDIVRFFAAWDQLLISADINEDNSVDGDDVILFFRLFDQGC